MVRVDAVVFVAVVDSDVGVAHHTQPRLMVGQVDAQVVS